MKRDIYAHLPGDFPWQVHWFDEVTSTNDVAKKMAQAGAEHGTAIIAGHQTDGRGRMGRSFSSPDGMGVYLSLILRPACAADTLMHLTCAAGIAMCNAVEAAAGFRPGIKWINDLVYDGKKLGGILTELSFGKDGLVDYAIIGIGINCNQTRDSFPDELRQIATSIRSITGDTIEPAKVAGHMLQALWQYMGTGSQIPWLDAYRQNCITLGKPVTVLAHEASYNALAIDVDAQGALLVKTEDGSVRKIQSGEVSIRAMDGYC